MSYIQTPKTQADWGEKPKSSNYVDAKTKGATQGVHFYDNSNNDAVIVDTHLDETESVITAGTNRGQGILREVSAGDFVYTVRLSLLRRNSSNEDIHLFLTGASATASVLAAGSCFVDGEDAEADSWYGLHKYLSSSSLKNTTTYYFNTVSGSNRFDAYIAFNAQMTGTAMGATGTTVDYYIRRVGTDLFLGLALPGHSILWMDKITVGAGAGLVGVRFETLLGETDYFVGAILKEYLGDTVFPF